MARVSVPRLVVITDLACADERRTISALASVLAVLPPSIVAVGLRDHEAPVRRRLAFGRSLVALARAKGAKVLVHDRVDVARAIEADGVQLGARSIDADDARALLPNGSIVARSCHDAHELARARDERADWATLSPIFSSPNKGTPLGEARFAELRASVPTLPILALGGVDASNVERAHRAGAVGVAVIRAVLSAPDPAAVARALVAPFASDPVLVAE
jgi:thiamine-phosphate pyrophosphorylase